MDGRPFCRGCRFFARQGFQIALTGSPVEAEKLEAVKRRMAGPASVLPNLSVQELIAVIDEAALYLGNDSGPAHLAAALNKPTVVLFGSSNSTAWSPWHTRSAVVQNSFECNPCPGYKCLVYKEPECIQSITVEQVKAAVTRLLLSEPKESSHAKAVRP